MATRAVPLRSAESPTRGFWRLAPWLSRAVMFPPAIIYTVLTLRYFTNPAHATAGATLNTPEAFTDTRVLGAWMLTLLMLLVVFLFSRQRLWLGHLQLAWFVGATLVARVFGFVHDGTTLSMGNQRVITIVEIVFLVLNGAGLLLQGYLHAQRAVRQ